MASKAMTFKIAQVELLNIGKLIFTLVSKETYKISRILSKQIGTRKAVTNRLSWLMYNIWLFLHHKSTAIHSLLGM